MFQFIFSLQSRTHYLMEKDPKAKVPGYIYGFFPRSCKCEGGLVFKIGMTTKTWEQRAKAYKGCNEVKSTIFVQKVDDAALAEKCMLRLVRAMDHIQSFSGREWFKCDVMRMDVLTEELEVLVERVVYYINPEKTFWNTHESGEPRSFDDFIKCFLVERILQINRRIFSLWDLYT